MEFPPKLAITPQVLHEELDGLVVLVNLDSGEYFTLDEVGSSVWRQLLEGTSPEQIARVLLSEYDVREDILRRDLAVLFDRLQAAGLASIPGDATDTPELPSR